MLPSKSTLAGLKVSLFLLCLVPLALQIYWVFTNQLGPDPAEALVEHLGDWALRFLLITLAVTPLRRLSGQNWLLRFRRMLGLYAFFYACLHLLSYFTFLLGWSVGALLQDFVKRPYITMGISAWLLLLPLAITSTRGWIRRLGRRWQRLHRLVYLAIGFAIVHFWWQQRSDYGEGLLYLGIFAMLMLLRLPLRRRQLSLE